MRITSGIKTKSALIACLLTTAIAMPAWSDTLVLRSGDNHFRHFEHGQQ